MSFYKRGSKYFVYVPRRNGGRAVRTAGTSDKATARSMDDMLRRMAARREWDLIDSVHAGRLTVAELYDADASGNLDDLRSRLSDVDVQAYVEQWLQAVRSRTSPSSDTADHYLVSLRTLMPAGKPFFRSQLTYATLSNWLSTRPVSPSTRRKYHAGLCGFCQHLLQAGVLSTNPMRLVKAPRPNPPRREYLSLSEAKQLVEAHAEPFRTVCALLHGTGMEISVALKLRKRDIDVVRREVRAKGTKTRSRDRIAIIAQWAWPYIERHIANLLPDAPLFPNTDRWRAADAHRAACKLIGRENYRQHDARHTFATIAIRAGADFEFVAEQLGHSSTALVVSTYGRYRPNDAEKRKWEERAEEIARISIA